MYLYLSGFVGTGRHRDAFRSPGMSPGSTILDLRPDCTVPEGYCILSSPTPVNDPRVALIGEDPREPLSDSARVLIESLLGVTVTAGAPLADVLLSLLASPPNTKQAWKPLKPTSAFGPNVRGIANPKRYELWMGNQLVAAVPYISGGASFSDNFNRANSSNDLGSDWTELLTNSYQILNNEVLADPNVDDERVWMWATDCDTANHFAALRIVPHPDFSSDLGPMVRMSGGSANGYLWTCWHNDPQIGKFVANTQTVVASAASDFDLNPTSYGRSSKFEYTWHRLHANGSSLVVNVGPRGAQTQVFTTTDTTLASQLGVGAFQYAENSAWDDWYGGDGTGEDSPVTPDAGPFLQKKIASHNGGISTFEISTDANVTSGSSLILVLATGPTTVLASHVTTIVGSTGTWVKDEGQNNGTDNNIAYLRAVVTGGGPLTVSIDVTGTSFYYCGALIETEPLVASPLTGTTKSEDVNRHINTGSGTNTAAANGFSITAMSHDGGGSPRVAVWGPPWTPLLKNTSTAGFPLVLGFKRTAPGDSLQGEFTNVGDVQYYALTANYELASGNISSSHTGSGGVVFGGSASVLRDRVAAPVGGLVFAGSGTSVRTINIPSPSAGVTFGGSAVALRERFVGPVGGMVFAGTAIPLRERVAIPVGGLIYGGAANVVGDHIGNQDFTWTPVGGVIFGGSGSILRERVVLPVSGLIFSGTSAPVVRGKIIVPNGGLEFGGTVTPIRGRMVLPVGELIYTGQLTVIRGRVIPPSGGIIWSGQATVVGDYIDREELIWIGTGGIVFGGQGLYSRGRVVVSAGVIVFGGAATVTPLPMGQTPIDTTPLTRIVYELDRRIRRKS
jgi:hypothetical protein